jgi:hypothetical protein
MHVGCILVRLFIGWGPVKQARSYAAITGLSSFGLGLGRTANLPTATSKPLQLNSIEKARILHGTHEISLQPHRQF